MFKIWDMYTNAITMNINYDVRSDSVLESEMDPVCGECNSGEEGRDTIW